MSSVSSTSSSSSTSSYSLLAKTGIGGLVSGMDTDELVYSLTSTTRTKIAAQKQERQLLEWKQTAYQSVTTALKEFQDKYFDILSDTYLGSASTWNTVSATSSSTAVTATTNSSTSEGTLTINSIEQLATKQSLASGSTISASLSGTVDLTSADFSTVGASMEGTSFTMELDGTLRTITFDSTFADSFSSSTTSEEFLSAVQDVIDDAFGVTSADDRVITASIAGVADGGGLTFTASGSTLELGAVDDDTTGLDIFGFSEGQTNKLSVNTELSALTLETPLATTLTNTDGDSVYQFTINGVAFEFEATESLSDIISTVNSSDAGVTLSYSDITDKFTISADSEGAGQNIVLSDTEGSNLLTALGLTSDSATTPVETAGQNAILTVNGTRIIRSSNDFTVNNVTLELNEESTTPITVSLDADSEGLTETMESFVEDYNSLISLINTLVSEDTYSDYDPLTEEQEEEMTDEQIEAWNEKAKSGILKGDSTLRTLASKLTSILYTTLGDEGTSLYEMGISSAGYEELGKLEVDTDKLTSALSSNIGEIQELFTGEGGLSESFDSLIDAYAKTSGVEGSRGILVDMAGYEDTTSATQNSLYDQLDLIDEYIEQLEERLEEQEEQLWTKFTAMETALSTLNSQSSLISSFASGE